MNLASLFSDELRRKPYPAYENLRASSLVLHVPALDLWTVFGYEDGKRALTDHESFSSSVTPTTGKAPDWLVFLDPPRHTKLRAILVQAFTPRSIAALEPRIRELSRALLEPLLSRGELDLAVDYAAPLPTLVIAEMLGLPIEDRPRFQRYSEAIFKRCCAIARPGRSCSAPRAATSR